jgi:hypothetical protein
VTWLENKWLVIFPKFRGFNGRATGITQLKVVREKNVVIGPPSFRVPEKSVVLVKTSNKLLEQTRGFACLQGVY